MGKLKVFDVNGKVLNQGDVVKIISDVNQDHSWLRKGNTLKVAYWEDRRSFLGYVIVFLKSKGAGKLCSQGLSGDCLELVELKE